MRPSVTSTSTVLVRVGLLRVGTKRSTARSPSTLIVCEPAAAAGSPTVTVTR